MKSKQYWYWIFRPCANLSRHALGLLTATVTPCRNFTKTTLSKTRSLRENLGEQYFFIFW